MTRRHGNRPAEPRPASLRRPRAVRVLVEIGYNLAEDDAEARRIFEKIVSKLYNYAKYRRLYDPFIFLNDAAYFQDPLHSYGQGNLRSTKAAQKSLTMAAEFALIHPSPPPPWNL